MKLLKVVLGCVSLVPVVGEQLSDWVQDQCP